MVTKGYIAAWANDRNIVDVLDVHEGRGYPSSIENASVLNYVYDPSVMTHDLEGHFAEIETRGVSAFARLRAEHALTEDETQSVIEFLDMHLHRGRYADRAGARQPARLLMDDGTVQDAELNYGDLLSLAHDHPDTRRLTTLGLEKWAWQIFSTSGLYTGDGAVLLWRPDPDHELSTVTFPLSPTQLLVIGEGIPADFNINLATVNNCRRWIVGQRGSLPIEALQRLKPQRSARAQ